MLNRVLVAASLLFSHALASDPAAGQVAATGDTAAVVRAASGMLRSDDIRTVEGLFACTPNRYLCDPEPAGAPLTRMLADLVQARQAPLAMMPECPWTDNPMQPTGYHLRFFPPRIEGMVARIRLDVACRNPPHFVHRIYGRIDELLLRRDGTEWRVVARCPERVVLCIPAGTV